MLVKSFEKGSSINLEPVATAEPCLYYNELKSLYSISTTIRYRHGNRRKIDYQQKICASVLTKAAYTG